MPCGEKGFTAAADRGYLVALETQITPELRYEGLARELSRAVNELRKELKLNLEDRVTMRWATDSRGLRSGRHSIRRRHRPRDAGRDTTRVDAITPGRATRLETDGEIIEFAIKV